MAVKILRPDASKNARCVAAEPVFIVVYSAVVSLHVTVDLSFFE